MTARFRAIRPAAALVAITLALAFIMPVHPIVHHDLWHEMALVREAFARGEFPSHDSFSYAGTGAPWIYYEWGAGLIGFLVTSYAGAAGLAGAGYLLTVATAVVCLALLRGVEFPIAAASVLLCISPLSHALPPITAQVYSNLIFGCLMLFLERDRKGSRAWIAAWLPLFVLWVNLHGGLMIGLAALGLTAVERALRGERWRHLVLVLAASVGLISANPNGLAFYSYLARTMTMPRTIIIEWQPFGLLLHPNLDSLWYGLAVAVFGYVLIRLGPRQVPGALVVLVLSVATLRAPKVLPLLLVAWLGTVPRALEQTGFGIRLAAFLRRKEEAVAALCIAALPLLIVTAMVRTWKLTVAEKQYPVGPVAYLKENRFEGNAMTAFMQGAYVMWNLSPKVKVGCDSRYDLVYSDAWITAVHDFYESGDESTWDRVIQRSGTDVVLVESSLKGTVGLLARKNWRKVFTDDEFFVYAREGIKLPIVDRRGTRMLGTIP